jgi:hypothetical protein
MFSGATRVLSNHLKGLFAYVSSQCSLLLDSVLKEVEAQISVLWEGAQHSKADSDRQLQINAELVPQVSALIMSVLNLQPQALYLAPPIADLNNDKNVSAPPPPPDKRARDENHDDENDDALNTAPAKKAQL